MHLTRRDADRSSLGFVLGPQSEEIGWISVEPPEIATEDAADAKLDIAIKRLQVLPCCEVNIELIIRLARRCNELQRDAPEISILLRSSSNLWVGIVSFPAANTAPLRRG